MNSNRDSVPNLNLWGQEGVVSRHTCFVVAAISDDNASLDSRKFTPISLALSSSAFLLAIAVSSVSLSILSFSNWVCFASRSMESSFSFCTRRSTCKFLNSVIHGIQNHYEQLTWYTKLQIGTFIAFCKTRSSHIDAAVKCRRSTEDFQQVSWTYGHLHCCLYLHLMIVSPYTMRQLVSWLRLPHQVIEAILSCRLNTRDFASNPQKEDGLPGQGSQKIWLVQPSSSCLLFLDQSAAPKFYLCSLRLLRCEQRSIGWLHLRDACTLLSSSSTLLLSVCIAHLHLHMMRAPPHTYSLLPVPREMLEWLITVHILTLKAEPSSQISWPILIDTLYFTTL